MPSYTLAPFCWICLYMRFPLHRSSYVCKSDFFCKCISILGRCRVVAFHSMCVYIFIWYPLWCLILLYINKSHNILSTTFLYNHLYFVIWLVSLLFFGPNLYHYYNYWNLYKFVDCFLLITSAPCILSIIALNEALTAEVQRLKIATAEMNGDSHLIQQHSVNPMMFQQQHQPPTSQQNIHLQQQQNQQQQQQQQNQQNGNGNPKTNLKQ